MIPAILPCSSRSRETAALCRQFRLAIPNIDWEDIACDDQGHLYLGDIGNNTRALPLRAIYRIDEPDPNSREDKPISASAVTFYALPRENRFDAESLFYDRGDANLLAKYLDGREAELFAVRLDPPSPLLRPAQPRSIGRLPGFTEAATGADLSADGTLLAACSSTVTRVYRRDDRDALPWRRVAVIRYEALPIEGIAWDGSDLRLVAEGGGFYRLTEQTWRAAAKPELSRPRSTPAKHPDVRGTKEIGSRPSCRVRQNIRTRGTKGQERDHLEPRADLRAAKTNSVI